MVREHFSFEPMKGKPERWPSREGPRKPFLERSIYLPINGSKGITGIPCFGHCFFRALARQRYTGYLSRHLLVRRESVTTRAFFRRRWRAKPPSYREMSINAWVHLHWTIQVGFHRLMESFSPFCGVRNNDRYADSPQPRRRWNYWYKQDNNTHTPHGETRYNQQSNAGVRTNTLVGPSAGMSHPSMYVSIYAATGYIYTPRCQATH